MLIIGKYVIFNKHRQNLKNKTESMRKVLITLILGLVFVSSSQSQDIKVGLLFDQLASSRWQKDANFLKENLEDLGAQTFLEIAHSDMAKQIEQAQTMIAKDYDALIVVCVDAFGAGVIVDMAAKKNIPVIAYDRPIMNEKVALYVSYDNKEVGRMQARAVIDNIKKGNILMINGPISDNNAIQFRNGQNEVLEKLVSSGDLIIKHDLVLDTWDEMAPLMKMMDLDIDMSEIDGIISATDMYSKSIIDYIDDETESKRIYITGQDLGVDGIINIKSGIQNMSVLKPMEPLAKKAAEITIKLIKNSTIMGTQNISLGEISFSGYLFEPILITQKNIEKHLNKIK